MSVESPIREQTREAVAVRRKWPWLVLALAVLGVWALARVLPGPAAVLGTKSPLAFNPLKIWILNS